MQYFLNDLIDFFSVTCSDLRLYLIYKYSRQHDNLLSKITNEALPNYYKNNIISHAKYK